MHGKERTAMYCPATDSLPCVFPAPHGNALCRAFKSLPCVKYLCRAIFLCHASLNVAVCGTLSCVLECCYVWNIAVCRTLPCGMLCCVACFAVRRTSAFLVRRRQARTTKSFAASTVPALDATGDSHVASLPCVCTRQSDQMVLCRVHTHGKEAPVFQIFSVFF
jgi:hypothetical protein